MGPSDSNREEEERDLRFGNGNYRTQYEERARWFRLDASSIYHRAEFFALIAVFVTGIIEWLGHFVLGADALLTVLFGVMVGSILAAVSVQWLGGKFFKASELFAIHMMVLIGYRYRGVTPQDVMQWIERRQTMSR